MNSTQNIEKLKSSIFEAFSKSVDQQYIYICDVNTNIWRWSKYAVDCFDLPGEYVLEQLKKYDFPKKQLMLELTESCTVINPAELAKELIFFREHGIQIALDDFGTGYASLSILRDLSADWIKVDHTFVAQITENDYDQALLEYLINLCKKLGLNVCVEGVETEAIQNVIQQYKPTVLQGYYYSRPVIDTVFEKEFIDKQ